MNAGPAAKILAAARVLHPQSAPFGIHLRQFPSVAFADTTPRSFVTEVGF
jgi:hypothetical protein